LCAAEANSRNKLFHGVVILEKLESRTTYQENLRLLWNSKVQADSQGFQAPIKIVPTLGTTRERIY
jgi:hypothetical protein